MNRDEAGMILAILKAAYPDSFKNLKMRDGLAMIGLWQNMFANVPYETVNEAVLALIATRTDRYSPTIGEVKEQMEKLRNADQLTEQQAWALVSKACSNGYYGYKKEFDKLPPEVQRAVGRPEQLRDWSVVNVDTFQTVVASNFMRSFRTQQARERENAMLPPDIQNVIGSVAENMKMVEGETDGQSVPLLP